MTRGGLAAAVLVLTVTSSAASVATLTLGGGVHAVTPPGQLVGGMTPATATAPESIVVMISPSSRPEGGTPSPARAAVAPLPHPSRASRADVRRAPSPTPRASLPARPSVSAVWRRLVACEAPDRGWRYGAPGVGIDAGYHFEGGPNFLHSTWLRYGGGKFAMHAYDATPAEQVIIAKRTLRAEGVRAWPVCGPHVGLSMSDAA